MRIPLMKQVAWYLAVVMLILGITPRLDAAMAPSSLLASPIFDRSADLDKIQRVLEMKVVQDRLEKFGFTCDEIRSRMQNLSDKQIHQIALQIDDLRVGKDGAEVAIIILVIVILVIVILLLTGHKVLVK
jgi:Family of unknown function (DUF6627)